MGSVSKVLELLESCYVPKLSRNLEERESHPEFQKWDLKLSEHFSGVLNLLTDLNVNEDSSQASVLSSILILYSQLVSKGPWNTKQCDECAKKLDCEMELLYETTCTNLLKTNKVKNTQEIFDKSIEIMHQKLSPDDFKKYPALIEAYCLIIKDVKDYNVVLNPVSVLPVSILLIEDYVIENKLKGLKTCSSLMKCLSTEHFKEGNYYEVIYRVMKKTILERDLEVTKLVLECLFDLLQILPSQAKVSTVDNSLSVILEQMYTETNLYRKKALFGFINKIIHIHGIHCVKRTMFLTVICDNLDICSNSAVKEILLSEVLECLENWIKYCWCVWKLAPNKKLMSALIKILYVSCKEDDVAAKIQNIFLTLCKLCTEDEQKEIYNNIKKSALDVKNLNEKFAERLGNIKDSLV
ncbi:hypothetical protein ABMA28_000792 [Loxostege sticticalis]|uniref:TELO2-interacting protein 2 n=1 Tax=Loxostege sticticalis TaxID=481309 RepID=A0ABD0T3M3_LOXSC